MNRRSLFGFLTMMLAPNIAWARPIPAIDAAAIRKAGEDAVAWCEHVEISHGARMYAGLVDRCVRDIEGLGADLDIAFFMRQFYTEKGKAWARERVEQLRPHLARYAASHVRTGGIGNQTFRRPNQAVTDLLRERN